jgi:uncharacterized protein
MDTSIGVIDLMIGFAHPGDYQVAGLARQFKDDESKAMHRHPAEFLFKEVPEVPAERDPIKATLDEMDKHNIEHGLVGIGSAVSREALLLHPDRFSGVVSVDPNDIGGSVGAIRTAKEEDGVRAVMSFPAGCFPQVPISDAKYYPIFQTCVDLDMPIILNAGVPGPRVPMDCQHPRHFDIVCYDFPELKIIMCHGAEPWTDLAVKLMLKWPGLHYMTSAFVPKHYPKDIIQYANTRGREKVMYAGYYPMGLSLSRIFSEMPDVPLRNDVWPAFLRDNARRLLKLEI